VTLAVAVTGWALLVASGHPFAPTMIWNASRSAPQGLWRREPAARVAAGDWVAVRPPPGLAAWMAERDYLPAGLLLIKRVAAGPGQWVCRYGAAVTVDGRWVASALPRDARGRALPNWRGCRRLARGEVFLLNPARDSLDGRYFGPFAGSAVVGRARLVWRPS
jgi:type IV secretory pathway protease TraF